MEKWRREQDILDFLKTKVPLVELARREAQDRTRFGDKLYGLVVEHIDLCLVVSPENEKLMRLLRASALQYIKLANWSQITYNMELFLDKK